MITYLVNTINLFLPMALLTGLLTALWLPVYGARILRSVAVSIAAGLAGGMVIYFVATSQEIMTEARTSLYAAAVVATLCHACLVLPAEGKFRSLYRVGWGGALFFLASLAAVAVFSLLTFLAERAFSAINLLNTELILNITGLLAGAFLIVALIPVTAHLGEKNDRRNMAGLILGASALLILQGSTEVLLGLMRLEAIEVTSLRLTLVAKVAKHANLFPYLPLIFITAMALLFRARRKAATNEKSEAMEKAERRKAHSAWLLQMRWFKGALTAVGFIFTVQLYYDLHMSRPPKISPAVNVTADAGRLVTLKVDEVQDGRLHRYSFVTDDGHVVRFFLINRARGRAGRIGVVYDDMGYVQEKSEIICLACNVRVYLPSIGKAGGYNPIPLKHDIEGGKIVIRADELDQGARYFSEMKAIN